MFNTFDWQPLSRDKLQKQAQILAKIRSFFLEQGVLEVSTPYLSESTTPDPAIQSVKAALHKNAQSDTKALYLHTSPEFAMKRMLVNGSGDIYQLCQVFRDSDFSSVHNAEFTMLEWYRLAYDHKRLMDEVYQLISSLNEASHLQRKDFSYADLFINYTKIDPFKCTLDECLSWCRANEVSYPSDMQFVDECLDLILSFVIQPKFPDNQITFVYDYPVSQAALAKIRSNESPAVASRFEMYWGSIELANGFHELQDAKEQALRFASENEQRQDKVRIDDKFLDALDKGLPDCSGVALGVSRLLLKLGAC